MGVNFSKPKERSGESVEFRCYYDLLDINQHATAEEIRKAYKVKAFQLHPDKNQSRVQEATSEFALVQSAYQVLSDPQERAWYDRHRMRLLKRPDPTYELQPSIELLLKFFCSSCYSGYDDSPSGFYAVYRDLFASIESFEHSESGRDSGRAIPSFGSSKTPYVPTLAEFYEHWTGFVSLNSFEHIHDFDEYASEGRRYRRAASKENQKLREKHRKEFSETVRALAAFVQKRDPRHALWKKHKLLQRAAADKEHKKKACEAKKKQAESYKDPEWSAYQLDDVQLERMLERTGSLSIDDAESSEHEELYCIPCRKSFRNKNQWQNHERSRKHRETLESLGIEATSAGFSDSIAVAECPKVPPQQSTSGQDQPTGPQSEPQDGPVAEDHPDEVRPQPTPKPKKPKAPKSKTAKTKKGVGLCCNACGQAFESRNQLFRHIEAEDHALKLT